MGKSLSERYIEELLDEVRGLSADKIKEVLEFASFVRVKESIDPAQAYFWTQKWQEMEREVDEDKKAGRVIGDGTVEGLLKELKR
ncbi:hypothetical protein J7K43_08970 [Candidatus Calescamantes bacterium]|nr:hypothetical protein [Candidatus Calescamantes bacterium]